MIYSLLFFIGAISLPAYASGTALDPVAQVDFSDPDVPTNSPFSLKNGAQILPAPDGVSGALRIDKDGPYALIPGVNISPSNMNECTLTAGLYLESIANRYGWVFGHEQSGYDRTILMHVDRFGGSIASAVGFPWKPWKNSNQPPMKKWVHVTAVFRQGGQSYVFLDGVRSDFSTVAKNGSGMAELWVGRPHHGGHWVNSWIKEVKVFDTALSDDFVKEQSKEFHKSLEIAPTESPAKLSSASPSVDPTSMPSIAPPTSSPATTSMAPSAAPIENKNNCDDKSKSACKKLKDSCVFGKSKIFGVCKPKKSTYIHNCADYDDEESCTDDENHGGLCKFNTDGCSHVCDDLNKKDCKKLKNTTNNKKICKATKVRNPCKGCQHKTTCG